MSKVSVLSGPERRRRWTTVEKRRIVEESQAPSASVVEVARRHDVHPNLLTVWRRQARTGAIGPAAALRQEDEVQLGVEASTYSRMYISRCPPVGKIAKLDINVAFQIAVKYHIRRHAPTRLVR